jgi:uncharacterized protein (TIGR02186 family)
MLLALAAFLLAAVPSASSDTPPFRIDPNPVTVGTFFRGGTVSVTGTLEPGTDVIVVIAGRATEETYNRKGRVSLLWATVGKVTIGNVPVFYLIASGTPVPTLLSRAAIDEHMVDLDALAGRATVEPAGDERALLVGEYLKLKRRQGVMGVFEDAVRVSGSSREPSFEAVLPWPATAPVGTYRVVVHHVRQGTVIRKDTLPLDVAYVGLPRLVAHMAFDRPLAFGIAAVVIALSVGLVIGLLFKRGAAGH